MVWPSLSTSTPAASVPTLWIKCRGLKRWSPSSSRVNHPAESCLAALACPAATRAAAARKQITPIRVIFRSRPKAHLARAARNTAALARPASMVCRSAALQRLDSHAPRPAEADRGARSGQIQSAEGQTNPLSVSQAHDGDGKRRAAAGAAPFKLINR